MKNIAFSLGASITTPKDRADITPAEWRTAMLRRLVTMHPSECASIETWDEMDTEDDATQADIDAATNKLPPFNPEGRVPGEAHENKWRAYLGEVVSRNRGIDGRQEAHAAVIMDLLLYIHSKGGDPIQVLGMALSEFAERTMGHADLAGKEKEQDNGH